MHGNDWGLMGVGLIQPDGSENTAGNEVLDNIFKKINEAYSANNVGKQLTAKRFKNDDELDEYATAANY